MTRRKDSYGYLTEKNGVDIRQSKGLVFGQESSSRSQEPALSLSRQGDERGTKICDDAWEEMCLVAQFLFRKFPDSDFYDLFNWIRMELYGGQEYSDGLLARVDREITTELGPWT